jgi:hypothetical protein
MAIEITRDMKRHDELAGLPGRRADTGDEGCERKPTRAIAACKLHFGVERQQSRHAVGRRRGVADIARDRPGVLDLTAADLARRLLQPIEHRRQVAFDQFAPGGGGAQPPAGGCL